MNVGEEGNTIHKNGPFQHRGNRKVIGVYIIHLTVLSEGKMCVLRWQVPCREIRLITDSH
jgi:hypothetical protein